MIRFAKLARKTVRSDRSARAESRTAHFVAVCLVLAACEAREPEPFFAKEKPAPTPAPVAAAPQPAPPPAPVAPPVTITREPTSPDPLGGKFNLNAALVGLPGSGKKLKATIETGMGTIECKLLDKTPNTVANFVGLARGSSARSSTAPRFTAPSPTS